MKDIRRDLIIALTTALYLSIATIAAAGEASSQPSIEGFLDTEVKCYCNSDKHGKYWLKTDEIEDAYKQAHSSPSIIAGGNNIYLIELPEVFKDASNKYAKECKPDVTVSKAPCWLKASTVKTSQDPDMIRSQLAIRQRDCSAQGTQMGSESCADENGDHK